MKILIIEPHTLMRDGLIMFLKDYMPDAVIQQTLLYDASAEFFKTQAFDLIITEIDLSVVVNTSWVGQIKGLQPEARILIHSACNGEIYALPLMEAGVDGFISKQASVPELKMAITTVLRDGKYLSVQLQTLLLSKLTTGRVKGNNPMFLLSRKERNVLELVIQGKSTKEMSYLLGVKANTISTFKQRVFKKMKVSNPIELSAMVALWW